MYGTQFAQTIPPRALDSDQSHFLHHLAGSDLSANRDLTWVTGNVDRQVTLQGDPTLADWFDQSVKFSSSPTFTGLALLGFSGVVKSSLGVLSGFGGFSDLAFAAADVNMGPYKFTAFQLESSISSGTPPLVVASADVVSNLNADLLDGQHASAFLVDISGQSLGDLSDVDTTGVAAGDFLQKSAGDWVDFDLFASNNTWAGTNQFNSSVLLGDASTGFSVSGGNMTVDVASAKQINFDIAGSTELFLKADELRFVQGANNVALKFSLASSLIFSVDGFDRYQWAATAMRPSVTNSIDLGTSAFEFKKAFFSDIVHASGLRADTDAGGAASTTTYVHGTTAIPGLGQLAALANEVSGTGHATWLHVRIGTTLSYIPVWQ